MKKETEGVGEGPGEGIWGEAGLGLAGRGTGRVVIYKWVDGGEARG